MVTDEDRATATRKLAAAAQVWERHGRPDSGPVVELIAMAAADVVRCGGELAERLLELAGWNDRPSDA